MTTERPLGSSYVLQDVIGRGAMGQVWRGRDRDGLQLAFKLLRPEFAEDPKAVQRFVQERSILGAISGTRRLVGSRRAHMDPVSAGAGRPSRALVPPGPTPDHHLTQPSVRLISTPNAPWTSRCVPGKTRYAIIGPMWRSAGRHWPGGGRRPPCNSGVYRRRGPRQAAAHKADPV